MGSFEEKMLHKSMISVEMAGVEPVMTEELEQMEHPATLAVDKEFSHFVEDGVIIHPNFYEAASNMIGKFDYAFCHAVNLDRKEIIDRPTPENFCLGQIIVKSWVVKELGANTDLHALMKRVLVEYRGIEIPHLMVTEIGL
jgi:hypothetical protein